MNITFETTTNQNNQTFLNNGTNGYNLFQSDINFYTFLISIVAVIVLLGVLLFAWMVLKPSLLTTDVSKISHPIVFFPDKNEDDILKQEFPAKDKSHANNWNVSQISGNQTLEQENPPENVNGDMSLLDTHLPPLDTQPNNYVKPEEIKKIETALQKVVPPNEGSNFGIDTGKQRNIPQLEQLDITSLSHMDDGFD